MLNKWVRCMGWPAWNKLCDKPAKYMEDDVKPVCEDCANRFNRLRYIEPADVEKHGRI